MTIILTIIIIIADLPPSAPDYPSFDAYRVARSGCAPAIDFRGQVHLGCGAVNAFLRIPSCYTANLARAMLLRVALLCVYVTV